MKRDRNRKIIISIDGPAASGKSTTARLVAKELGYLYIDTGAMYRALTLEVLNLNVHITDEDAIIKIANRVKINFIPGDGEPRTILNGKDVSADIRLPKISRVISTISTYGDVRNIMKAKQRALAKLGGIVMDGRDIGTVVFPHAELKIFMDATVDERTDRRVKELKKNGIRVEWEEVKNELIQRDLIDSSRDVAPLKPAEDAHIIDTSKLTIEDQVQKILSIYKSL